MYKIDDQIEDLAEYISVKELDGKAVRPDALPRHLLLTCLALRHCGRRRNVSLAEFHNAAGVN
jgi:hypothetical protein